MKLTKSELKRLIQESKIRLTRSELKRIIREELEVILTNEEAKEFFGDDVFDNQEAPEKLTK